MKKTAFTTLFAFTIFTALLFCACSRALPSIPEQDSPPDTLLSSEPPLTPAPDITSDTPEIPPEPESNPPTAPDPFPAENNPLVLTAQSLLGIHFSEDGSSPSEGFDNSGFIYYVLKQNGYVNPPRSLTDQSVMGNEIHLFSDLRAGDLVFFSEIGERARFGGIYTGSGIMVSCRMPGETVREININSTYYKSHFFKGVRVL